MTRPWISTALLCALASPLASPIAWATTSDTAPDAAPDVGAAGSPATTAELFATAVVLEDGDCAVLPGLAIPRELSRPSTQTQPPQRVKAIWSWSNRQSPWKREIEETQADQSTNGLPANGFPANMEEPSGRDRAETRKGSSLEVRVTVSPDTVSPSHGRPAPDPRAGIWVLAGPEKMWRDVPEACLPARPVDPRTGRTSFPVDGERSWKVRAVGTALGSWWAEAEPGRPTVDLQVVGARDVTVLVEGRSTDSARSPLTGAALELYRPRSGGTRGPVDRYFAFFPTDEEGIARVPTLPAGHELMVVAAAPDHLSEVHRGPSDALPDRLLLTPGATLQGQVTDPAGEPLAEVDITAYAWASPLLKVPVTRRTRTDAEGAWELATVPFGEVALTAEGEAWVTRRETITVDDPETVLPVWTLESGIDLPVLIRDDVGTPVAAAGIYQGKVRVAETDARGRAIIEGVSARRGLSLQVGAEGYLPTNASLAPPFPDRVTLRMTRAVQVVGVFQAATGEPITAGEVSVHVGRAVRWKELSPEGRFETFLPPGEPAELLLSGPASREVKVAVAPGTAGEVRDLGTIVAPTGVTVRGRVLRSADGEPVAGARVWTPRLSERGESFAWYRQDLLATSTDADGVFELHGLPRASTRVRIDAPGCARHHLGVEPPPEETVVDMGEIWVERGAEVVVWSEHEMPPGAIARLDLRGRWSDADMLSSSFHGNRTRFSNVPAGTSILTIKADRELLCETTVEVPRGRETVEVVCEDEAVEVAGVVLVGGEPGGPGRLKWLPRAEDGSAPVIARSQGPMGLVRERIFGEGRPERDIAVGRDGRFRSGRLRPGEWQVVWLPENGASSPPREVHLRGTNTDLVLSFPAHSIRGRVVREDGEPVAGARVRELTQEAFAFSAEDGSFEISGVREGVLRLRARHGASRSPVVDVANRGGRPLEPVELVLGESRESRVAAHVMDRDGFPVPGAFVFLERGDGGIEILSSRADGRVEAELSPPLPARIRAAAFGRGIWAFGEWLETSEAVEGGGLVVRLGEPGAFQLASPEYSGAVPVVTEGGWDLSRLMLRIGRRLRVSPSAPLTVTGLPPGPYRVGPSIGRQVRIAVREGETAEAELASANPQGTRDLASAGGPADR